MSFNTSIRLFYEPNAEEQAAYNNELEKTRNLTNEVKNNFTGINNELKLVTNEAKQLSLGIGETLNKLQKSRNLINELRKDFVGLDSVIKKSIKIDSTPIINNTDKIGQSIDNNIISKISNSEEAIKVLQALFEKIIVPKITPSVDSTNIDKLEKDFDKIDKKSLKVDVETNISQNINNQLKEKPSEEFQITKNITDSINTVFIDINNNATNVNTTVKSINQNIDVFVNKLKTAKGLVSAIKNDFDRIDKKSPKVTIKANISQDINDQLKETEQTSGGIGKVLTAGLASGNSEIETLIKGTTDVKTATDQVTDSTKNKSKEDRLISFLLREQRDTLRAINDELKGGFNYSKEVRKQYGILEDISTRLVDNDESILELSEKQLEKEKSKAQQAIERLKESAADLQNKIDSKEITRELTDQENALLKARTDGFKIETETLDNIELLLEKQKQINKATGITGSLLKSIEKISGKLGITGLEKVFKEANKEAAKTAKTLLESDKNMSNFAIQTKTMGAGLKTLGKGIISNIKDPLVILGASFAAIGLSITLLKKFFDLYGSINQRLVDQRKQLGLSEKQSQKLYDRAKQYTNEQRDAFVTEGRILEGRAKLNEALGTSIDFSEKEAIMAEKLSHYYGISNEQNANLVKLGKITGKDNSQLLSTILKTTNEQKRQYGGQIAYQKVVQQVSNVSGDILTKFKGNVSALTAAVVQADRLGLTLEQVDKIGESLLNFEQSIDAELKAELLTGKAINLEKARSAALSGDTSKLMNEIVTQVGNIHQFERMNTIQRKAYAEAFGMTASEMGDMLRKQDFENKLQLTGKETAEEQLRIAKERGITIDESIRKDLEAKSLAELQKYTFEKIREILARITEGPMSKMFSLLEKGLKFTEKIFGLFGKMTGGGLGSALGAAIIGIPAILGAIGVASVVLKLFSGQLIKNAFLPKPGETVLRPMFVTVTNPMALGGGAMSRMTLSPAVPMTPGMGPRPYTPPKIGGGMMMGPVPTAGAGGFKGFMAGGGYGLAAMGTGMLTSAITSNMETGGAKTAVSTTGGAATGALTGAMIGSIIPGIGTAVGAAIGGLVGGIANLTSEMKATREKEEAEKAQRVEAEKRTQELIEQLSIRPLELNVNNETIGKWNTYSSQNGANPAFS